MRNVSDISYRENQVTHLMLNNPPHQDCAVCEIMWKNVLLDRQQITTYVICSTHFAYRITKATGPHSEYVILIAFSLAAVVMGTCIL
jgi:hypothetical protein